MCDQLCGIFQTPSWLASHATFSNKNPYLSKLSFFCSRIIQPTPSNETILALSSSPNSLIQPLIPSWPIWYLWGARIFEFCHNPHRWRTSSYFGAIYWTPDTLHYKDNSLLWFWDVCTRSANMGDLDTQRSNFPSFKTRSHNSTLLLSYHEIEWESEDRKVRVK